MAHSCQCRYMTLQRICQPGCVSISAGFALSRHEDSHSYVHVLDHHHRGCDSRRPSNGRLQALLIAGAIIPAAPPPTSIRRSSTLGHLSYTPVTLLTLRLSAHKPAGQSLGNDPAVATCRIIHGRGHPEIRFGLQGNDSGPFMPNCRWDPRAMLHGLRKPRSCPARAASSHPLRRAARRRWSGTRNACSQEWIRKYLAPGEPSPADLLVPPQMAVPAQDLADLIHRMIGHCTGNPSVPVRSAPFPLAPNS
jgi:hypothetical protein